MHRLEIIIFLCLIALCSGAFTAAAEETEGEYLTRTMRERIASASTVDAPSRGNALRLRQTGASNVSDIVQTGDLAVADVLQDGVGNTANIDQVSGQLHSQVVVRQYGAGHTATVSQEGGGNSAYAKQAGGNSNSVDISQDGYMNTAWVSQRGSQNQADIKQTSSGNTAVCKQFGNRNEASISQTGNMVNEVIQVGNGHEIHVSRLNATEGITVYQGWK